MGNIFMLGRDDSLQLRLFRSQDTPSGKKNSDDGNDQRPRSPLCSGERSEQAASRPSTPVHRDENQASDRKLENFIMSPNRHIFPADSQSPQYYSPSTPRSANRPTSIMDLMESPLKRQKPEAGPAWKEIQSLRADVWDLRSQIQQMRATLREKQDIKAAAEDKVFRRITNMTAQGLNLTEPTTTPSPGQKSLAQLMHDCQEARNEYGPLEDDCMKLEDQVSRQEFKLARLEDQFFDQLNPSQQLIRFSRISKPDEEQSISGSEGPSDDDFEASEYHPLVNEYLSKMGDLDLMHERLDEFRDEKTALEAEKASRQRFGRTLSPDDQNWLSEADIEYQEITSKIHSLEQETENLKQRCLLMNLIDQDGEPTSFEQQEVSHFARENGINSQDRASEYVKYPLLLPHPPRKKHKDISTYEPRPDMESDKDTAATRINEWILDKLRISPLDVILLASTFESIYGRISKDWQYHVLRVWYQDDTTGIIRSHGQSTSLASHTSSMITRYPELANSLESSHRHILLAPSRRRPSVHIVR